MASWITCMECWRFIASTPGAFALTLWSSDAIVFIVRKLVKMIRLLLVVALACGMFAGVAVGADSWEWPVEMSLGGFTVTSIRGTVNEDGSGAAAGLVQIPGVTNQKVALNRSAKGDIAGVVAMSARMYGAEMQGSFALDADGLRCRVATFKTWPKPVIEAAVTVSTGGQFTGTGRVPLSSVSVPVKFTSAANTFGLDGTASIQTQADTPLATYTFSGELKLQGASGRLSMMAKGTVQRSGKLSNQVSASRVSDVQVNPVDGTAAVSVEGVSVTFNFFRP